MSGVSFNDNLRAAQLDGALAFNSVFAETQELISSSALSGLSGLREAMGQSGDIAEAFRQLEQVRDDLNSAISAETNNRFSIASLRRDNQAVITAVDDSLKSQTSGVIVSANSAVSAANNANNGSGAASATQNAATVNEEAALALADGDSEQGRTKAGIAVTLSQQAVTSAQLELTAAIVQRDTAQVALNDANAALQAAQEATPQDPVLIATLTATRDAAQAVLNAKQVAVGSAQAVLGAAQETLSASQATLTLANSPIALIDSETPTVYDLENGYSVSTWGDSGYWTLIDENGEGIIVSPDGEVDPLDGSGEGWQFSHTSTFVLPDETKITVTPGAEATVRVSRGDATLQISELASGQIPEVKGPRKGGRGGDQAQNDGHIFTTTGPGSSWKNGNNLLGDAGNREQVATTALQNELKLDPLDVEIPEELRSFLEENGFDFQANDYDGDGKLNAAELTVAAEFVTGVVGTFSATHQAVLTATAEGVEALFELNLFLEGLLREVDDKQEDRKQLAAEEANLANAILERLNAAFAGLENVPVASFQAPASPPAATTALPPALEEILGQISGASPEQLSSNIVTALGQAGVGSPTEPGLLSSQIEDRLAGLAQVGASDGRFASLVGELGVLLARAAGGGELTNTARGALNQQITDLLESRLGGALPPGAIAELAQQISGVLAQAAGDGDISLAGVTDQVAGLLGSAAAQGGLTGAAIATLSRQVAAFLPQVVAGGALPNGGLIAFVQALVTAVERGGPEGSSAGSEPGVAGGDGNALRRAGRLISGFSLNPRIGSEPMPASSVERDAPIDVPDTPGDFLFGGGNTRDIIANLKTDGDVLEQVQRNLDAAIKSQGDLLGQAKNLFAKAQETVENFFSLISDNQLLQEIVFAEDLSEADNEMFMEKMNALYRNWGIEWGSSGEGGGLLTPEVETQLVNKAVTSGTMI